MKVPEGGKEEGIEGFSRRMLINRATYFYNHILGGKK